MILSGRSARFRRRWLYCCRRISVRRMDTGSTCSRTTISSWPKIASQNRRPESIPTRAMPTARCNPSESECGRSFSPVHGLAEEGQVELLEGRHIRLDAHELAVGVVD